MRRLLRRLRPLNDERGDVPGWVLITLMTAALVLVIWSFAGTLLGDMFQAAMKSVTFG
jgi:hypothetical protein